MPKAKGKKKASKTSVVEDMDDDSSDEIVEKKKIEAEDVIFDDDDDLGGKKKGKKKGKKAKGKKKSKEKQPDKISPVENFEMQNVGDDSQGTFLDTAAPAPSTYETKMMDKEEDNVLSQESNTKYVSRSFGSEAESLSAVKGKAKKKSVSKKKEDSQSDIAGKSKKKKLPEVVSAPEAIPTARVEEDLKIDDKFSESRGQPLAKDASEAKVTEGRKIEAGSRGVEKSLKKETYQKKKQLPEVVSVPDAIPTTRVEDDLKIDDKFSKSRGQPLAKDASKAKGTEGRKIEAGSRVEEKSLKKETYQTKKKLPEAVSVLDTIPTARVEEDLKIDDKTSESRGQPLAKDVSKAKGTEGRKIEAGSRGVEKSLKKETYQTKKKWPEVVSVPDAIPAARVEENLKIDDKTSESKGQSLARDASKAKGTEERTIKAGSRGVEKSLKKETYQTKKKLPEVVSAPDAIPTARVEEDLKVNDKTSESKGRSLARDASEAKGTEGRKIEAGSRVEEKSLKEGADKRKEKKSEKIISAPNIIKAARVDDDLMLENKVSVVEMSDDIIGGPELGKQREKTIRTSPLPSPQEEDNNKREGSPVEVKLLDDKDKLNEESSTDAEIKSHVIMKANVNIDMKQSMVVNTTIENHGEEATAYEEERNGEDVAVNIGDDVNKEELVNEIIGRRAMTPDGPQETASGDDTGFVNRPSTAGDSNEVPPFRRNATPTDSDQIVANDADRFNPPMKTSGEERLDANENPALDYNVLAGRAVGDDDDDDNEMPWAMYRTMEKEEQNMDDEDDGFSADDEEIGNDFKKGENLPEFYEYLGSLDNGDTQLESTGVPPQLFGNEQQKRMHQRIDEMKLALAEEEIGGYLEEFERQVEKEVLMVGSIGLEEMQDEERNIRDRHREFQKNEAQIEKDKHQELISAMDKAKEHVMKIFRKKYKNMKDKEQALSKRDERLQEQIREAFKRSEKQLVTALGRRKQQVKDMFGDLVFADKQYGGKGGERWKVDWNKTTQPIQIKLKCLRSVRDKLPIGQYVLMVALYSRLGGHLMKWSDLKGQKWGAATMPLLHDGEFYNTEMKIDQSVFTRCPSKPDMRPGMVLMFELYILSGPVTPIDKVCAWGCFPICDGNFNVIDGKCKTPLLRGTIDPSVEKFQMIEERLATDLEYWMCNLYFEIVKMPRYLEGIGQKEYEVELHFSSGLVSYPIRTKTGEDFIDGEYPVYGSVTDIGSIAASRASMQPSIMQASSVNMKDDNNKFMGQSNIKVTVEPPRRKVSRPNSGLSATMKLQRASVISTELRQRRASHTSINHPLEELAAPSPSRRKSSLAGVSRRSVDEKSLGYSDETDTGSGTDYDEDDVCVVKKDYGFRPVKNKPGMYFKEHQNNPADIYARKLYKKMPETTQASNKRKKKRVTHLDDLKQHSYNVKSLWSNKGHVPRRGREKMQYIGRMMLAELGFSQWRDSQFWCTMFMLVVTWFMRLYLHYFGQWVLLKSLSIPINKFNFYAHTVNLNYQDTLLQARHEMGIVIMGPFTNFLFFFMFIPLTYGFQRFFKWFPAIITQFMLAFGIQAFLDPLWILLVDVALGRYKSIGGPEPIGDAFKLYWHFYRNYRNADVTLYVGMSLTIFLYVVIAFSTAALWYMFFTSLHNNGRLMDVYWRLHGSEDEFFLPYDLEVSNEELNYICMKSEQWRGEDGERRKVAVYDYVWEQEELDEENWDNPKSHGQKTGAKEVTTHLSIHTISQDGLIELYRQFLRLPDGAIIEVFGELNMPGIDEGVKQALMKRTGFQGTSNNVRRSRSLSINSLASANDKNPLRRMSSNRLDVPV